MKFRVDRVSLLGIQVTAVLEIQESGTYRGRQYVTGEQWNCLIAIVFEDQVTPIETMLPIPYAEKYAMAYAVLLESPCEYPYEGTI